MGAVCILVPVVIVAWPALSAAVVAAAASLGYAVAREEVAQSGRQKVAQAITQVNLEIPNSEVVTGQLGLDQRLTVTREGIAVVFSRDARGKVALCVSGQGHSEEELRSAGTELSHRIVQKYVYQRLMNEMQARQFNVVEETTDASQAIHIKVRHWGS